MISTIAIVICTYSLLVVDGFVPPVCIAFAMKTFVTKVDWGFDICDIDGLPKTCFAFDFDETLVEPGGQLQSSDEEVLWRYYGC
jgi:hypothetical protein